MKSLRLGWSAAALIASVLFLTGCVPGDPNTQTPHVDSSMQSDLSTSEGTTPEHNSEQTNESQSGSGADRAQIPHDFWAEAPVPDFELMAVDSIGDQDYVLYMRGTDIEADAYAIEAMLMDAGFHRLAWGITEERGATGIFLTEDTRVTLSIVEKSDGVEIEYGAGPRA